MKEVNMFMLSPFAMAVLVTTEFTLLSMIIPVSAQPVSGLEATFLGTVQTNILFGGVTLVWGYVCVGLGLGKYRLLKRLPLVSLINKLFELHCRLESISEVYLITHLTQNILKKPENRGAG
jgi:hypothetical protein